MTVDGQRPIPIVYGPCNNQHLTSGAKLDMVAGGIGGVDVGHIDPVVTIIENARKV